MQRTIIISHLQTKWETENKEYHFNFTRQKPKETDQNLGISNSKESWKIKQVTAFIVEKTYKLGSIKPTSNLSLI